ncbi:Rv2175c family DNA-binding protein [Oerskovia flava]|uniref:Rv2175c family DNA-binding protein n=1 Tax=Oerskovia flava TaxID=2986422 RepID=UPI00223F522B|nr:Rv2175c family DNA-binding protein [Oerskovia sp. JB1-3-2]
MNDLDALVPAWLTLPDLAEAIGVDVGRARHLVQERRVVGVRRGERSTFQVPAAFLVAEHLAEPSQAATPDASAAGQAVLGPLQGTIVVLTDSGFSDEEIIEWLFTPEDELGSTPIDALREGRKTHVRRIAQTLA